MLIACACGASDAAVATASPSVAASTPTPSPSPSAGGETPIQKQALAPASDLPVSNLCQIDVTFTADGNVTPLLCPSGALNVQAWFFYKNVSASVLGLGLNPTEGQVESAICDDLAHNHATRPEEASGYKLASTYYGWSFAVDVTRVSCS
ncbi:MAG TPA: hypothetical protein VKE27_11040 [Candidatus Dormibacteraeota bacterium]|nr:hypothetical protein [Candidatus Dormibacteraeota bacterium]